jgi:DNA (cytosine-5)-methyltransferase 1
MTTKNKIKIFDAFTGYGGASWGLKKAGINFEIVDYSEIDKFACQLFDLNHKKIKN